MTNELVNTPALVELQPVNGEAKPVTTSLRVAEYFEKEHKHVLRDIRDTLEKCSMMFGQSNFGQSSYTNEQGKEQPMYLLTRDGFMIVAMSYTGEKAMQLKEAYIGAFNEMEHKLTAGSAQYADPRLGFDRSGGFSYGCPSTMEADCGTVHLRPFRAPQ